MKEAFDLNLLRILDALDRTRQVTRAALALDMSQSGFSTALQRLRKQFDDPLFVRTANGMEATPRARPMIDTARTVLASIQSGVLEGPVFEPKTAQGEVRLAMADVAEVVFLPRLLKRLKVVAPSLEVRSELPRREELSSALEAGTIDLALGYFPDLGAAGFTSERLYTHTYVCMVRPRHPALKVPLSLHVYSELGHAVVTSPSRTNDLFEHFLDRLRIKRRIVFRTPHHLSLPAIVEQTDLVATVPLATAARYARAGLVTLARLPFDPPFFPVCQHWHRRKDLDPRSLWLRAQIKDLFSDDTDEWVQIERGFYGRLRERVAANARTKPPRPQMCAPTEF